MSELINEKNGPEFFRARLLSTACTLALLASAGVPGTARAEDATHPTVWLELGSQLEQVTSEQQIYDPSFLNSFDHLHLDPVLPIQRFSNYAIGGEGKITFAPQGSDWQFSAAIQYGRSNGAKAKSQLLPEITFTFTGNPASHAPAHQVVPYHLNATASAKESHTVIDFQAGKDVGLGMSLPKVTSVLSLGVRFAQFTNSNAENMNGVPDYRISGPGQKYGLLRTLHHYSGSVALAHNFNGVGPSISWSASERVLRGAEDEGVSLDWGLNASVLFGRQKVNGQANQTMQHYTKYNHRNAAKGIFISRHGIADSYYHHTKIARSHNAVVPNLGGFAGVSLKFPNAKVSLGYRADFFFNAMDQGIDARNSETLGFYGPFATISIGLGG